MTCPLVLAVLVAANLAASEPASGPASGPASSEAASLPSGQVNLAIDPSTIELGGLPWVELVVTLAQEVDELLVTTNVGEIAQLHRVNGREWRGRYVPPQENYPQIAIVSAVARRGQESAYAWRALRLVGRGNATVRTKPFGVITVRIGDRVFGPVKANARGVATVPVVVPPGAPQAFDGFRPIDLGLPSVSHVHVVLDRSALGADESALVTAWVFAVDAQGFHRPGAPIELSPEAGVIESQEADALGIHTVAWRLPVAALGASRLTARLKDEPESVMTVALPRTTGAPSELALVFDRAATPRLMAQGDLLETQDDLDARSLGAHRQGSLEASLQMGAQAFRFAGDDQLLATAFFIEPRVAYRVLRPLALELSFAFAPTRATTRAFSVVLFNPHLDVALDLFHLGDGVLNLPLPALKSRLRIFPYASAGLGVLGFAAAQNSLAQFSAHLGAGVKVGFYRDLGARLEVRGVFYGARTPVAIGSGVFGNLIVTLGAYWAFGGQTPAPAPIRVVERRQDLPASAPVCAPSSLPMLAAAPPPDRDSDGLDDAVDLCPTVAGATAFSGCPLPDQDDDGVLDEHDDCATEVGTADKKGCPAKPMVIQTQERLVIRERTRFELDKADILPDYLPVLDAVASLILKHPEIEEVGVHGHTDNQARPDHNTDISTRRAEAVVDYLVSRGIVRARLRAKGFGDVKPIASNKTAQGRAENRRVEFVILKRKGDPR